MSIHNLCFEKNYEKYQNFLSENFPFLVVKFSIYLNRRVFVMRPFTIKKTHLFKYIENFTSKNRKFSDKKLYFSYFCSKHRLYLLELPQ